MQYNIHPILVHFPLALLVVYSFIKIIPLRKWFPFISWADIERALLFFGVLGAFVSLSTGEMAEHVVRADHDLVEMHALFATLSTWLYGALLVGEILAWLNVKILPSLKVGALQQVSVFLEKILCNRIFSICIAVVALVCIVITGMLGGVMVYGVTADPLAPMVLKLLGISL